MMLKSILHPYIYRVYLPWSTDSVKALILLYSFFQVFSVMIFLLPMYYLCGLPRDGHRIIKVVLIVNLLPLVFQDYGILVGTLLDVQVGTSMPDILYLKILNYC